MRPGRSCGHPGRTWSSPGLPTTRSSSRPRMRRVRRPGGDECSRGTHVRRHSRSAGGAGSSRAAALVGFGAFLAACTGTRSVVPPAGRGRRAAAAPAPRVRPARRRRSRRRPTAKAITGPLKFANWPAYIDLRRAAAEAEEYSPGSSPTLESFKKKYGVEVDYQEKIGDNARSSRRSSRRSSAGLPTGWDLDGPDRLDGREDRRPTAGPRSSTTANVPTAVANLRDAAQGRAVGPEQRLPLPVAVGHDRRRLQREDPRGEQHRRSRPRSPTSGTSRPTRCRSSTEARDTFGLTLLKLGIDADPATRSPTTTSRRSTTTSSRWSTGACASRQRVPAGLRARRRSGRRWSGPATSRRRAARTTSSSSPRRGR